jgi:cell division septal protein FtsQ
MRYNPQRHRRRGKTRFDVALAQRARRVPARLPRWSGAVVTAALVLFGLGAVAAWFLGSDWRINQIDVQNNMGVPVEAIIGASALQGEHYQFADLNAAAKRIDDLPGVEAAQVTCRWSWKTDCAILIQPARAMALWETPRGNVWNDYEGKIQRATEPLPVKVSILVEEGDAPAMTEPMDARLLRALNELITVQPEVTRYAYSKTYGFIWTNEDKQRVRLGWADYDGAMSDKLKLARALRQQLKQQNERVSVLDVRFAEAPYYIK